MVASFDGHLKEQLFSGEYFRFHCPRCHSDSTYAHPMLYYDAQKRFVVMLNEKEQETSFQPDILCVQVHTSEDFAEHLHILEDDLLPAQILAIKRPLQQRYPNAEIRYDCRENDALWFVCQMGCCNDGRGENGRTWAAFPQSRCFMTDCS